MEKTPEKKKKNRFSLDQMKKVCNKHNIHLHNNDFYIIKNEVIKIK